MTTAVEATKRGWRPGLLVPACIAVSALVSVLFWTAQRSGTLETAALPSILLLGAISAVVVMRTLRIGPAFSLDMMIGVHLMVTFVLVTVLVFFTGGMRSPFSILYVLTTLTGALYREMRGGLAAAAFSCLVIGLLAFMQGGRGTQDLVAHACAVAATAFLAGALVRGARRREEKLAQAGVQLEQFETSTQRVLESVPVGIVSASVDGKILRINHAAAQILGIESQAGEPRPDLRECLRKIAPQLVDAFESAAATGKWSVREEIRLGEGRDARPIGISMTPYVDEEEKPAGVVLAITELQEQRRMEKEMRRSEQLATLGELAAGVAHEIRNPLASISGSVQVLRDEIKGDGDAAELMELIVKESERLNRIINGFLDYTRDHSLSKSMHDISLTAYEVVRLLSHDKNLSIGKTTLVEFPKDQDFHAMVEEEGIKQVFFNLARNALEAMHLGGILRITGESPGDGRIYVVFRDTGVGIAPHELEHVFKPFHTSKQEGTGLGLSIASRIVEGHGGAIRIRSTPGMGTAITVELPAVQPPRSFSGDPLPKKEEQDSAVTALD
jgi:signal transduction histidine kinase